MEDVESEDRERCFRYYRLEPSRQEPSAARHSFYCAERVFDRTSPDRHQTGVGMDSGLHAIKSALIDKPMDRALDAGRASRLQGAVRTG